MIIDTSMRGVLSIIKARVGHAAGACGPRRCLAGLSQVLGAARGSVDRRARLSAIRP
jgi:hypothetical protein